MRASGMNIQSATGSAGESKVLKTKSTIIDIFDEGSQMVVMNLHNLLEFAFFPRDKL